jgi:hypothetical protein
MESANNQGDAVSKTVVVPASYVRQALKREVGYVTEIEHLKAWIKHIGLSADICTRSALGEVCENCRCKHAKRKTL